MYHKQVYVLFILNHSAITTSCCSQSSQKCISMKSLYPDLKDIKCVKYILPLREKMLYAMFLKNDLDILIMQEMQMSPVAYINEINDKIKAIIRL